MKKNPDYQQRIGDVGLLLLYGADSRLASKPAPALVQTESGQAFPVAAIGSRDRTYRHPLRIAIVSQNNPEANDE